MTKLNSMLLALPLALTLGALPTYSEGFSVDLRNAPVSDAIRLLAKAQGMNIVVPEKLPGRVNANFPNVEIPNAIAAILDSNQLGSLVDGDVTKIIDKKTLQDRGHDLVITNFPLRFAKAPFVAPQIKPLLSPRGQVTFDIRSNSVTVRDTPVDIENIASLLKQIDHPDRQVLIEARIVEATTNFLRGLGIQWGFTGTGPTYTAAGVSSVGSFDSGRLPMLGTPLTAPNAGMAFSLGPFNGLFFDTEITAAEQKGILTVLSRPSIVTTNNQPATIHSGQKFYVRTPASLTLASSSGGGGTGGAAGAGAGVGAGTSSTGSSGTSTSGSSSIGNGSTGIGGTNGLQEIDSGITLVVTPQITVDNKVSLLINVTESQPDFSNSVDGIPSIVDNIAQTTVLLENGATTVIGGLFQKSTSNQRNGIPFLKDIPILGYLFGSNQIKDNKKELIIFLKPTVVAEGQMPAIQEESDNRAAEITELNKSVTN